MKDSFLFWLILASLLISFSSHPAPPVKIPPVPPGMALIPAGEFDMGDAYSGEGHSDELPVHTVYVSAFVMDQREVTIELWQTVKSNTTMRAYFYSKEGTSYGTNHPVHSITWYDAVKWCNARSEAEGLMPVYYTDTALTNVYRSGEVAPYPKWNATGYRLPTEAEWEKAARGGLEAQHYPWPSSGGTYTQHYSDTKAKFGWVGGTAPVGSYKANNYGLYDMAGNVYEWCWDWYQSDWYSEAGATQNDSRGPREPSTAQAWRVLRGGAWFAPAFYERCAHRASNSPSDSNRSFGFRCVRGSPSPSPLE